MKETCRYSKIKRGCYQIWFETECGNEEERISHNGSVIECFEDWTYCPFCGKPIEYYGKKENN